MRSNFIKKVIIILLCILAGSCFGCKKEETEFEEIVIGEEQDLQEDTKEQRNQNEKTEQTDAEISDGEDQNGVEESDNVPVCVFVCGAVKKPGVYELPEGSRIKDALDAAGGMKEEAVFDYLNQAAVISDGQQIYVPTPDELEEGQSPLSGKFSENADKSQGEVSAEGGKVDLNKASKEELMTLPGIGESKADSILRYREEHGGFKNIEELMEIQGIKSGVFQKIQDDITVS